MFYFGGRASVRRHRHKRRSRQRYQRLLTRSQILPGEVVEMTTTFLGASMRGSYYEMVVRYRFRNPEGHAKDGTQHRHAYDNLPPQPPGTPIRVLYADDDAYVML